mgnify:CR=1 FL=1
MTLGVMFFDDQAVSSLSIYCLIVVFISFWRSVIRFVSIIPGWSSFYSFFYFILVGSFCLALVYLLSVPILAFQFTVPRSFHQ